MYNYPRFPALHLFDRLNIFELLNKTDEWDWYELKKNITRTDVKPHFSISNGVYPTCTDTNCFCRAWENLHSSMNLLTVPDLHVACQTTRFQRTEMITFFRLGPDYINPITCKCSI